METVVQESGYARSLIEASLDPLVTINTNGKITDMNAALTNIIGMSREQLTDTDFFDYFTEPQKAREVYQEVFAKGSVADSPLTLRNIHGKLTDVLFNGSVYKDNKGNVRGVVIVARDVTDQKRVATELLEAKVFAELATEIAVEAKGKAESATLIAEAAVKSKQQFLSNMSHEIRTPMNAIIGFTKVVLKTDLNAKQREYINAIKLSGDALIVLINDILDLAKVDAGKMTFARVPFKLSFSISAMLHLFETKIQEKNIELIKEYDSRIPEVLVGDPVRLHQIILNLVGNAVKFTSKGRITVSVKMIKEEEEFVCIEFAIKDTGIGIAENKIGNIFDDFQQATSETSRIYGGTGLGLAIVKQLVEGQGGRTDVQSRAGHGSTFSFVLEFLKTNSKVDAETDPAVELVEGIKNVKILVVEDIPLNQLLMRTLLEEFGFGMDIAGNGKIALEQFAKNTYDIILMDLQMPEMNGFETTEYIRNTLNSKVPIIALTADVTTVDIEKCMLAGMNDYISKPIDDTLLYSKLIRYLKKPEQKMAPVSTDSPKRKTAYIDLTKLVQRTRSKPMLMVDLITLYLEQTPVLLNTMKQALEHSDWVALRAAAHKILPSFSIVGMSQEYEVIAKLIQEKAGNTEKPEALLQMILQLEHVCLEACKELEENLKIIDIQKA